VASRLTIPAILPVISEYPDITDNVGTCKNGRKQTNCADVNWIGLPRRIFSWKNIKYKKFAQYIAYQVPYVYLNKNVSFTMKFRLTKYVGVTNCS
jgi:hypothetical protein